MCKDKKQTAKRVRAASKARCVSNHPEWRCQTATWLQNYLFYSLFHSIIAKQLLVVVLVKKDCKFYSEKAVKKEKGRKNNSETQQLLKQKEKKMNEIIFVEMYLQKCYVYICNNNNKPKKTYPKKAVQYACTIQYRLIKITKKGQTYNLIAILTLSFSFKK